MSIENELLTTLGLSSRLADYDFSDVYRVPVMKQAPVIDGYVDEEEWRVSAGFDGLSHEAKLVERRSRVYVGATRTHFYFAIVSELPPGTDLVTEIHRDSTSLVWDDSVEVWICPDPDSATNVTFQMLANSAGYVAYQSHSVIDKEYYGWKGNYKVAQGFHDGFWHCEIEVPIEDVAKGRSITEGKWGINVCRNWKRPWDFACLGNYSYLPHNDIVFMFQEDGTAAIHVNQKKDVTTREVEAVLSAFNPGTRPITLDVCMLLKRSHMPAVADDALLTIAPGETAEFRLKDEDIVSGKFALFTIVREKDGPVHYSRHFAWGPPRESRWEIVKREVLPIDFKFSYYPYRNSMRIRADISNLSAEARLDTLDFVIRPKPGGDPVRRLVIKSSDFAEDISEVEFDMPTLSGDYEIVATPTGVGVPEEPVTKEFIRYTYEWERLGRGTSRKVYPPFTPIEIDGHTLKTVMKEYDLNPLGLMDGIRTTDQQRIATKEILAAPMTYTATVAGVEMSHEGARVEVIESADDIVVAESSARIGTVDLDTISTLDYDGTLKVELTISAKSPTELQSLDLIIPLRADIAKSMHAMTDYGASTIVTQAIPDGSGKIWSAAELVQADFPKNFCTYIFLGDPRRGLCWFAENDSGWSWDRDQANIDIFRADEETVQLRVHLVNKPYTIDSPRTITFGLLASPVKPLLDGWRHKWYTDDYTILGCDRHWFALGICGSVYPAGRDMHLWEMLKRGNTERLSDGEIEEFVSYGSQYYEPWGWEKHLEEFVLLARRNLRNRLGKKMIFYYNRASSPVYDEWQTFADEWGLGDFNQGQTRAPYEVKVIPSDSYIDYALYWYGKSFDVAGNTGVYIDNNYFCAGSNIAMTSAYREDDGAIMPTTGLWALRELGKRTFIYLNERGMLPINMVHMSTHMILPMNSFYTVHYDWEWHHSEGDVHDRFSQEYLLLASSADHNGSWPIMLHDAGKLIDDPWTQRTFAGVCTVHELIIDRYPWHGEPIADSDTEENRLHYGLRMPICAMTQNPECEVYRYWDDRPQPVAATDPELRSITYLLRGREAIVAVTNYSQKDQNAVLRLDVGALGMSEGLTCTNMETGEILPIENGELCFPIKKHDLKQFRLTTSPGKAGN